MLVEFRIFVDHLPLVKYAPLVIAMNLPFSNVRNCRFGHRALIVGSLFLLHFPIERERRGASMAARRPDGGGHAIPLHRPRFQTDSERIRVDRDSGVSLQAGQRLALGHAHLERVQKPGEEQEDLHTRQNFPQTHSSADAERKEEFRLHHFAFCVQETGGIEFLGLLPQRRVHVDGVKKRHDLRMLRQPVAVVVQVPETEESL